MGEFYDEKNPLIAPCKCSGSLKYIHLACIQKWIFGKIDFESHNGVLFIIWDIFKCELCKENFPYLYEIPQNKVYNLFDFNEEIKFIKSIDISKYICIKFC